MDTNQKLYKVLAQTDKLYKALAKSDDLLVDLIDVVPKELLDRFGDVRHKNVEILDSILFNHNKSHRLVEATVFLAVVGVGGFLVYSLVKVL